MRDVTIRDTDDRILSTGPTVTVGELRTLLDGWDDDTPVVIDADKNIVCRIGNHVSFDDPNLTGTSEVVFLVTQELLDDWSK